MKKFFVSILINILLVRCFAARNIYTYFFQHFTVEQGLASNNVNHLVQDKLGLLYIATDYGLSIFNGLEFYEFENFTGKPLDEHTITRLAISYSPEKVLWIGTFNNGLKAWLFDKYKFLHFNHRNGLPCNIITALRIHKHQLAVGTYKGFALIDLKNRRIVLSRKSDFKVNDIFFDDDQILLATDQGLWKFSLKTKRLEKVLDLGQVNVIEKFDGKLLLGTEHGLKVWAGGILKDFHPLVKNFNVTTLAVDGKNLWIGTHNSGLISYDSGQITFFSHQTQRDYTLSSNHITSLLIGDNKDLWIGTWGGGLNRLSAIAKNFVVVKPFTGNKKVQTVYQDKKGNIWLATADSYLSLWDRQKNTFKSFNIQEQLGETAQHTLIKTIYEDTKNRLWIGTDGAGLNLLNVRTGRIIKRFLHTQKNKTSLSSNRVWAIAEDKQGNIWIGTFGGGLNKLNEPQMNFEHFLHSETDDNSLICNFITTIFTDQQNRMWIGTTNGLDLFSPLTRTFIHFLNSERLSPDTRWINNIIQTKDGTIWAATKNGLVQIDPIKGLTKIIDTIRNNLADRNILNIVEDELGRLWLTTQDDLVVYNPHTQNIAIYNRFNGLYGENFTPGSLIKTKDGQLLLANDKAVSLFEPKQLQKPVEQIKTFIKHIYIAEQKQMRQHKGKKHRIILQKPENRIRIELDKVVNTNHKIKYQYKLEGYDDTWHTSDYPVIEYHNLPPHKYLLHIRAIDTDGHLVSDIATIEVFVAPNLWQQTWFRAILILGIIGIVGLLIYLRFRYYHKLHEQLNKKVKEKTRELEQTNKQLLMMIEKVQRQNEEIKAQNELLKAQKAEIEAQKDALEAQSKLLQQKNEEIQASIRYAVRIQRAIFPSKEQVRKIFPEHFILFIPREIISGDFYWVTQTPTSKIAVVGDCTGHGIPGAFMSILGISLLNKVVKEYKIFEPAQILNSLRSELLKALVHEDDQIKPYDGIDLSLVKIDIATQTLTLAAANHTIYLINPEDGNLYEYKGDRMPIGLYEVMKEFSQVTVNYTAGQIVYLFTDGYADQFGGPYSKKFKYSRFKETLIEISSYPMEKQRWILEKRIKEWMDYPDKKNNLPRHEQIDDILIFGIKL